MIKKHLNFFKKKSENKILFLWIFSYLIIFAVVSISNIFLYSITNNAMTRESEAEYSRILHETCTSFDSLIEGINNIHTSLSTNMNFKEICRYSSGGSTDLRWSCSELSNYIKTLSLSNEFDLIYIKFNNVDIALSQSYFNDSHNFFNTFYQNSDLTYEEWTQRMQQQSYGNCYEICTADGEYLEFLYQVPLYSGNYVTATLVFRLNKNYFDAVPSFSMGTTASNFIIMDTQNTELYSSLSDSYLTASPYDSISESTGILHNRKQVEIYEISPVTSWKFAYVIPKSIFEKNLNRVQALNIIQLLFAAVLCIAIALYFARKNSRPFMELASVYQKTFGKAADIGNSYDFVDTIITDYMDNKKTLKKVEHKYILDQKDKYYIRLLQTGVISPQPEECEPFVSDSFSVIIFRLDEHVTSESDDAQSDYEDLRFFIIQNVMEELLENEDICHVFEYDGNIVSVVNYLKPDCDFKAKLENAYSVGCPFIEDNFNFSFSVFSSTQIEKPVFLPVAYTEALSLLKINETLNLKNNISFYDDALRQAFSLTPAEYNSFSKLEKELSDTVLSNDFKKGSELVNKLIALGCKASSTNLVSDFSFYLGRLLFNMLDNVGMSDSCEITKTLLNTNSYIDLSGENNAIFTMLKIACERHKKADSGEVRQSSDDIFNKTVSFINQSYTNSEINVFGIGKHLNMSPYYISSIFKKMSGENMGDYINRLRVEKAKELIRTTDMPIAAIWPLTGFCNEKTFVRNFVKFESVTPAKYKELYHM